MYVTVCGWIVPYISWLVVVSIQVVYVDVRFAAYLEVFTVNHMAVIGPQTWW
jgi:hypothetical protein